jgi:long-chain fatty acid transport protein
MTFRNTTRAAIVAITVAVFSLTGSALAGAIYLTEVGTPSSLGTAGAGNVTEHRAPAAAWTNPAGMMGIDRSVVFFGGQVAIPKVEFETSFAEDADGPIAGNDGGNAGAVAVIPSFFWVKPLSDDWRFGLAVTAPFGGGLDYSNNFYGRYHIQMVSLTGVALTPSLARRITDRVSIGGGVSIASSMLEMDIMLKREDPAGDPLPDGEVKIRDADDLGFQPFVGLQWQYSDNGRFGVVYRGEMDVELEGDVKIDGLPLPIKTDVELDWDNPQMLEVGIRQQVSDRWTIVANADWEDWSAFSKNVLTVSGPSDNPVVVPIDRNWDDTYKVGIGAARFMGDGDTALFFGAAYDTSPVEDEDRTMDFPVDEQLRLSCSFGRDRGDKLSWALGGTAMWLGDGKVDQTSQGVRLVGDFDKNWSFFVGGTLRKVF